MYSHINSFLRTLVILNNFAIEIDVVNNNLRWILIYINYFLARDDVYSC